MTTTISHDAFGRYEVVRHTIPASDRIGTCDWCGNGPRKYRYGIVSDGDLRQRSSYTRGAFCSKSCHDASAI